MRLLVLGLLVGCMACGTDARDNTTPVKSTDTTPYEAVPDGDDNNNETTSPDDVADAPTEDTPPSPDDNTDTETDTDPPEDDFFTGSAPTSCGAPNQGLEPVDCTENGDVNAQCVFSNHCYCNNDDGFQCPEESQWGSLQECDPGQTCIPTP